METQCKLTPPTRSRPTEETTPLPPSEVEAPSDVEVASTQAEAAPYDIGEWRGRELVDRDGERIGKLEEIYSTPRLKSRSSGQ